MKDSPDSGPVTEEQTSMFFYGTLMNTRILERVVGRPIRNIRDAQLTGYCRLKIRNAHYPGLLPASIAELVLNRPPTLEEQTVAGKLVSGLTSSEVARLDAFEGEEYESHTAPVKLMDCISPDLVVAVVYLYTPAIVSQNVLPCVWSYDERNQAR
ncbi:hypothetical protein PCANC_18071 [Puccinia coronata f. sp. avenae]|uniref:Putative gamma-glutamylcyclotransferase n=1 Tax=Puccinia coronata f. sp. avenae TaxID=200324 RepID=A0A2N5UJ46_9BASI|nr:hypothetical protein PCASD_19718 [Puccinia coronata f. sp. avenae]PLW37772.1 hypothetical protein PCANC_18071 [Puccinia coronata f. sp. avenae]